MADADEEDKTGDVEPPRDAIAQVGDNQPVLELPAVGKQRPAEHRQQEHDPRIVSPARAAQGREHVLFKARPPCGKIITFIPGQFIHRLSASMRRIICRCLRTALGAEPLCLS